MSSLAAAGSVGLMMFHMLMLMLLTASRDITADAAAITDNIQLAFLIYL